MNKLAKFIIIIGVCLICLGLVISRFNFKEIFNPFINAENYEKRVFETDNENLLKLIIDVPDYNIEIIPTKKDKIKITYYESESHKFTVNETSTALSLKQKDKWQFFVFDFHFGKSNTITVEIPENLILAYDIKTTNGSFNIKGLDIEQSTFKTTNGSITASKVFAENKIDFKTTNGSIKLTAIEGSMINAKTTNGKITLNNIEAFAKIDAYTTNGKIELLNLTSPYIKLHTSNGSVKGTIRGDEHEFRREMKTTNGSITINGTKYSNKIDDQLSKEKYLYIKTTNGGINIDIY